ncbi:permease [Clostridium aceticum]|uniref:Permease n=1 Tax=Clostridium aceticum TaxID=84022 RepID=A0A0D8I983_9CLOT|nr:AEC family transporter [Clostridium aceticum]AKL93759.1 permease [Clostridium aceticum]KJF25801.1 hypothetical protein TZ02_16485 [Clostridium aceticum]
MTFFATFNQILILFLTMMIGYGAKKLKYTDNTLNKGLSNLILHITLPAMIIKSMQFEFSKELFFTSMKVIILSLLVYAIVIGISFYLPKVLKVEGKKRDVFQFMLIFSNVGYMGYPIVDAIYGEIGVFYTALYNIPFNFIMLTFGVYVLRRSSGGVRGKVDYKKVLLNPGILAVGLGFSFFLLSIKLPLPIYQTLDTLGSTTTPLAMLVIGSFLADMSLREVFKEEKILWIALARLVILPAIVMGILWVMGVRGLMLGIPVVITAMPAAANAAVFATLYDSDHYLASKGIFLTTALSLVTIPLLTFII